MDFSQSMVTSYVDEGKKALLNALRTAKGVFPTLHCSRFATQANSPDYFSLDDDYIKSLKMNNFIDNLPPI